MNINAPIRLFHFLLSTSVFVSCLPAQSAANAATFKTADSALAQGDQGDPMDRPTIASIWIRNAKAPAPRCDVLERTMANNQELLSICAENPAPLHCESLRGLFSSLDTSMDVPGRNQSDQHWEIKLDNPDLQNQEGAAAQTSPEGSALNQQVASKYPKLVGDQIEVTLQPLEGPSKWYELLLATQRTSQPFPLDPSGRSVISKGAVLSCALMSGEVESHWTHATRMETNADPDCTEHAYWSVYLRLLNAGLANSTSRAYQHAMLGATLSSVFGNMKGFAERVRFALNLMFDEEQNFLPDLRESDFEDVCEVNANDHPTLIRWVGRVPKQVSNPDPQENPST